MYQRNPPTHQNDPFSRLITSLDAPRFSKATIDGNDLLEDRYTEQQRRQTSFSSTLTDPSHNNPILSRPESTSLRISARRSQAISDRLRTELEDVRHENALLATRYSTLTQKLQQTSSRSISSERKLLEAEEDHRRAVKDSSVRLKQSEDAKLTLEKKRVELSELKATVSNLKKEYGEYNQKATLWANVICNYQIIIVSL